MDKLKSWFWVILLSIITSMFLIQFANGVKYTYYSVNDINHVIKSDVANCVIYYDFFSMKMSCVKGEVK